MTDMICVTCDGRRVVVKSRAATSSDQPGKTISTNSPEPCPNCEGKGRVKINP